MKCLLRRNERKCVAEVLKGLFASKRDTGERGPSESDRHCGADVVPGAMGARFDHAESSIKTSSRRRMAEQKGGKGLGLNCVP